MISKSPDRNGRSSLLVKEDLDEKFKTVESQKNNLEYDLLTTQWILDKVRANYWYAQHLYAALCNNDFTKNDLWPLLKEQKWHCSWRSAGRIVADMCQTGVYTDWYCSGTLADWYKAETVNETARAVAEGVVTDEVETDLYNLGWVITTGKEI